VQNARELPPDPRMLDAISHKKWRAACPLCGSTIFRVTRAGRADPPLFRLVRWLTLRRLYRCVQCHSLFEESIFIRIRTNLEPTYQRDLSQLSPHTSPAEGGGGKSETKYAGAP
jgi:DNA-directed RNA polymerase subunit RPC12/RpoP